MYHYPEYIELLKAPGENVYPNKSVLKAENCILYMQERDDPISQGENDSVVGFKKKTQIWNGSMQRSKTVKEIFFTA